VNTAGKLLLIFGRWLVEVAIAGLAVFIILMAAEKVGATELDIRLTVGGYSKHLLSTDVTNESHDHFAIQVMGVELGRFNNSYSRESWYLAYEATWENVLGPDVDAFLKSGVVYGYVDCLEPGSSVPPKRSPYDVYYARTQQQDVDNSGAWCPMVAPGLRYTGWELADPELTLVGDALNLGVSRAFDLMSLGKP